MPGLNAVMDAYDRSARLYPMVLVLLPIVLAAACWAPTGIALPGLVGGTIATFAVAAFLTQLARDPGKAREKELFRLWGGRPSDRALSYGGRVFADGSLARCHKKLLALDPALNLPSSRESEKENAKESRAAYAAASELLVARTRDKEKFPLLFKENIGYGFRRSLWGMKRLGILTALLGAVFCAGKMITLTIAGQPIGGTSTACGGTCVLLLVIWCIRITPNWVRVPAEGYAKQLVGACESL